MENDKTLGKNGQDIFSTYGDEISKACERAVREALLKHKRLGNPIAISQNGKVIILQPDEIEID